MVSIVLLSLFPVAGYLAIVVLISRYIRPYQLNSLFSIIKYDPWLIYLLGAFGLSFLFTRQHFASLVGIIVFGLQVSLFLIIRSRLKDRYENFNIINYLLVTSLVVSCFGIFQFYVLAPVNPDWLDQDLYRNISSRAFSTLYNPNVLGSYLILIVSIAFTGFEFSTGKYKKLLLALVAVAGSLCIALTFSRGAWLGLAVSLLIIFIFSKRKRYILIMLGAAALLMLPELKTIISRINLDFLSSDSSNVYRWYLWKTAINTFLEHPFFGGGIGSFGFFIPAHFKAPGYLISHAHNIYLQLLAETGIFGFTAFLGYIINAMYICYKVFRHSSCRQTRSICLGVLASSAGVLVHGAVDATLYLPQFSIFVWILIAVARNLGDLELAGRRSYGVQKNFSA